MGCSRLIILFTVISLSLCFLSCSIPNIDNPERKNNRIKQENPTMSLPTDSHELYALARRFQSGQGVKKDIKQAFKLMKKSAEQGYAIAQTDLGFYYEFGMGTKKNNEKAIYWYKKAVQQDEPQAMNNLATFLKEGRGVAKDCEKVTSLYQRAAEEGITNGQYNLGMMYQGNCGVTQDYEMMIKWITVAALNGNANAQANLGYFHRVGKGVPKNYEEAYYWSVIAARQGVTIAKDNASLYRKQLAPSQISRAEQRISSFRPRALEQQRSKIILTEFTIQPHPIPAGGRYEVILRYNASDPRVPYEQIPIEFQYEISNNKKVLFASKSKIIQSNNNKVTLIAKRKMKATKRRGTYAFRVFFKDGKGRHLLETETDLVIE